MSLHQVLVTAAPGDATTTTALQLRHLLRQVGPSDIYAVYVHPQLAGEVLPLDSFPEGPAAPGQVTIAHASIGDPGFFSFLWARREKLVLVYHNVSPPRLFVSHDPRFAAMLAAGRSEIATLAERVDVAVAPSAFNAAELVEMGYPDVRIVPLVADPFRLDGAVVKATTPKEIDGYEGKVALFVGQMLPHKRPDFLLQAMYILTTCLDTAVVLAMVGSQRMTDFAWRIEMFVRELHLSQSIRLVDLVTDEELVAWYRRADVFVTASEHEGVCVPLLEAMYFDLPVVARSFAAVPETLAGAGLLLGPEDGPAVMAEAIQAVLENPELAGSLRRRGEARISLIDNRQAQISMLQIISELVS